MEIEIIFDTAFQGQTGKAVWMVASDENRGWFEKQSHLDTGSALFTPEAGEIGCRTILRSIWNVQDHYPDWSRITVIGIVLTSELSNELRDDGTMMETEKGFAIVRA